jgi:hypothetical protein
MSVTAQLTVGGNPVPQAFYNAISALQVEELSDQPSTLLLRLPISLTAQGDLEFVGDGTFEPFTPITFVAVGGDSQPQCLFDGYVLSWKVHLDRTATSSSIEIWAQDATWLMATADNVVEWTGLTDGEVANSIFSNHGFSPADGNTDNDSAQHTDDGHTLFQRGNDLQFLRGLARRGGKIMRVACTGTPGNRTGYFVSPSVDASPATTISLVDPNAWNVDSLEFTWDVLRPTQIQAGQVDMTQSPGQATNQTATSSGLDAMDQRDYSTYTGQTNSMILSAAADVPDLNQRATAVLADSGFFVKCTGETTTDRLKTILRVGDVVTLEGAGSIHSGNWLVWEVRSEITTQTLNMKFTLVRNAVGPPAQGGAMANFANAVPGTASPLSGAGVP